MRCLIDTGVLLRLPNRLDPAFPRAWQAIRSLKTGGHELSTAAQNIAEFWNVSTRPATARGGYGLDVPETLRRLRLIERLFPVVTESPASYHEWRKLVSDHEVRGVQVHDARLVALASVHGLSHILTLNANDFRRFPQVGILSLEDALTFKAVP